MQEKKDKKELERISHLRGQLSPEAADVLFEVNSAAYEGVRHTQEMLKDILEEKNVVEESSQLMELFEKTGIISVDK